MKATFTSHRPVVMGTKWMIASGHPLASQAGAALLEKGGNAVDAAIAANAVLCVVRPHMCGIGGDTFVLFHKTGEKGVRALNATGRTPYQASKDFFDKKGLKKFPEKGMLPVTVPGAVDGWITLLETYGTMDRRELFQRAIEYAEEGFPVYRELSDVIEKESKLLRQCPASEKTFLKNGRSPKVGERLVQKEMADSFRKIVEGGREAFYRGDLGKALVKFSEKNGGLLTARDLEDYRSTWVEPLETTYKGYRIHVMPPNSQGLALLMQANILENFDLAEIGHNTLDYVHLFVEAKKLVFADRDRYVCDPDFRSIPVEKMISKAYGKEQAARINLKKAAVRVSPTNFKSTGEDTIYLAVVDRQGNAVSLINSLYEPFGSGMMIDGTGILLHNRGKDFRLDPTHFNCIEPHKRPYHTLSPSLIFKGEEPFMVLGSPGADGQTQTLIQVLANLIDFGADIQGAVESPRWRSNPGNHLHIEGRFPAAVIRGLKGRGHKVEVLPEWSSICGGALGIMIDHEHRTLLGGGDPRRQDYVIGR